MSATMQEGVATPPLTLREVGATCATFVRAELAAQERRDNSGQWFAAYEAAAAAALSMPATSIEEVMILAALVRGVVSDMSNQLQVALRDAPREEERAAQELGDRIYGALTSVVQALHDLTGTPIDEAAADYDWCVQLDGRPVTEGAP